MMILQIAGVFYQFFAQSKDFTLSEVKRKQIEKELIERRPNELDNNKVNSAYFLLLYLGLIDRVRINGKITYRLTQSTKIIGQKRTILINTSLESDELKYNGINYKIFDNEMKIDGEDIFDSISMLQIIPKISSIIKSRFVSDIQKPAFKYLEKWQSENNRNPWNAIKTFDLIPSLYKVYLYDKRYYEYYFWNKGRFYKFPFDDFIALQLVKSYLQILNKKVAFNYDDAIGELWELLPILEPIRKILFTHHILTTGDIPLDYRFKIDSKIYKQIKRIYK